MARYHWVGPWLDVNWDEPPDEHLNTLLLAADRIPGVELRGTKRGIRISWTAVELSEIEAVLQCLGSRPVRVHRANVVAADALRGRKLYPFQRDGLSFLASDTRGGILADDMGLGKTTQAIAAAVFHTGTFREKKVIVAPLFTRDTWRREVQACCPGATFVALEGRDANAKLPSAELDAVWYFCHYDIIKQWWERLSQVEPWVVIIDEAHWAKNARTKRGNGAMMISAIAKYKRILLTGTPMENRPSELHSLLSIACGKGTWGSMGDFRRRYCGAVHNGFGLEDTEPTNVDEFKQRLDCCYLRREAKDVGLELPGLTRTGHLVDVDQVKLREATHKALAGYDMRVIVEAVINQQFSEVLPILTNLRKVTSAAKLPSTIDYVANLLEQGESVVVFCWRGETAGYLVEAATRVGVWGSVVKGSMDQVERARAVYHFQQLGGLLAATYGTLREGVTLTKGRIVIMHDLDWVLSRMIQAERRIYRIGQTQACQSIWMLAEGSFDKILAPMLQAKAEANTNLMGTDHLTVVQDLGLDRITDLSTVQEQVDRILQVWEAM